MIRALIVDDEAPARREMRRLLGAHDGVQVIGEAADVESAAKALRAGAVDVVFLDIRLGRRSGFDLLPHVEPETAVVFVTAYDDYARQAFDAQALDYLMKPVDPERLATTLRRLTDRTTPAETARFASRAWLFLDDRERPEFIRVDSISHVLADGDRSILFTTDGKRRSTSRSLGQWEARLPADDFVRSHRSAIVNLHHVERIEPWFHYSFRIHVRGAKEPVPLSRRKATDLRQRLG